MMKAGINKVIEVVNDRLVILEGDEGFVLPRRLFGKVKVGDEFVMAWVPKDDK